MKKLLLSASVCLLSVVASAQQTQWFLRDKTDTTVGISVDRTYRELLKNRKPTPVVVAVIDGGIDATHEDLRRVTYTHKDAR